MIDITPHVKSKIPQSYDYLGLTIIPVLGMQKGVEVVKTILADQIDAQTALYLSGGKTPESLYTELAREEQILPGAVLMIDERFGEKLHSKSNERLLQDTGMLRYLMMRDIIFHPILTIQNDEDISLCAEEYDTLVRKMTTRFSKSIGLLGVGADGHTAGVPVGFQSFLQADPYRLVFAYANKTYGRRVSMSLLGLSMLDVLIVLVIGKEKKDALRRMFSPGSEDEIPARFYLRPEIAPKTILITDQEGGLF